MLNGEFLQRQSGIIDIILVTYAYIAIYTCSTFYNNYTPSQCTSCVGTCTYYVHLHAIVLHNLYIGVGRRFIVRGPNNFQ